MSDVDFQIEGATDLRADLRRFAPDLNRDLQRTLTGQANVAAAAARDLIPSGAPLSGWSRAWHGDRLRWDSASARAGIRGSTARGRVTAEGTTAVVVVVQNDPAGALFEVAARRSGSPMGARISSRHGPASRAAWRAVDAKRAQVTAAVRAAVERAETELNARIRGGGF